MPVNPFYSFLISLIAILSLTYFNKSLPIPIQDYSQAICILFSLFWFLFCSKEAGHAYIQEIRQFASNKKGKYFLAFISVTKLVLSILTLAFLSLAFLMLLENLRQGGPELVREQLAKRDHLAKEAEQIKQNSLQPSDPKNSNLPPIDNSKHRH
ncbi:MAG: hypothetical protein KKB51_07425 [Candidatus Riflebacteria bacterium]|nr:hypothetical protein [Candidatus Riflebacteria bacterium]